jgi:hypothetical protein
VPEGYKTGAYSAFTLFSDNPPQLVQEQKSRVRMGGGRPRARELTPFCGILKVGGLAQQQWDVHQSSPDTEDQFDDMPSLSQGSTISSSAFSSVVGDDFQFGGNKRRFDGDAEEDEPDMVDRAILGEGKRVIAVPRRMKKAGRKAVAIVGQENMGGAADFEDADFLDYGLIEDEVEMGGV